MSTMPPPPPKFGFKEKSNVPDSSVQYSRESVPAALVKSADASPNCMPPPQCASLETPTLISKAAVEASGFGESRKRLRAFESMAAIVADEVPVRPKLKQTNGHSEMRSSSNSRSTAVLSAHPIGVRPATLLDRILVHRMAGDAAFVSRDFSGADSEYLRSLELCGPKGEASLRASLHYNHAVALLRQIQGAASSNDSDESSLELPIPASSTQTAHTASGANTAAIPAETVASTEGTALQDTTIAPIDAALLLETACSALASACDAEPTWADPHLLLGHARHKEQPELAMRHFQAALRCKAHSKALRARLPNGVLISNQRGSAPGADQCVGSDKSPAVVEASDLMLLCVAPYSTPPVVPSEWCVKESRSKRGRVFFMHRATLETRWDVPPTKPVRFVSGMSSMRW